MASADILRAALSEGTWLTVQQSRRVRKNLARKKVPLVVEFRGGEYLEMVDMATAKKQPVEEWLRDFTREELEEVLGHPLGYRYEILEDGDAPPPVIGSGVRAALKRGKTPRPTTGIIPDSPDADAT